MPRRPSEEALVKVTMKLFAVDHAELRRMYGDQGVSDAVRTILRNHVSTIRSQVPQAPSAEIQDDADEAFPLD